MSLCSSSASPPRSIKTTSSCFELSPDLPHLPGFPFSGHSEISWVTKAFPLKMQMVADVMAASPVAFPQHQLRTGCRSLPEMGTQSRGTCDVQCRWIRLCAQSCAAWAVTLVTRWQCGFVQPLHPQLGASSQLRTGNQLGGCGALEGLALSYQCSWSFADTVCLCASPSSAICIPGKIMNLYSWF